MDTSVPPLSFFYEIAKIPRASGDEAGIRRYLSRFAQKRGLPCKEDSAGNVLIRKPGQGNGVSKAPLLLQAHMDMVYLREETAAHTYGEPLNLRITGDWLEAVGTTLGADNGIGIALILSVLDAQALDHPPLCALFTVCEEEGLAGALNLDPALLPADRLLNLDGEEEGILLTGCAGAQSLSLEKAIRRADRFPEGCIGFTLSVSGLAGGHSGLQIHTWPGNALRLLARLLQTLAASDPLALQRFNGGEAMNAIPREAQAQLLIPQGRAQAFLAKARQEAAALAAEWQPGEPGLSITFSPSDCLLPPLAPEDTAQLLALLTLLPNCVLQMSHRTEGLVQTSNNLGLLQTAEDRLLLQCNLRSAEEGEKHAYSRSVAALAKLTGFSLKIPSDYPAWQIAAHSPLQRQCSSAYQAVLGQVPVIQSVHCGLECGCFLQKRPGLDILSAGPTIQAVHSTRERVSLSSVLRFWAFLQALLSRID